MRTQIHMCLSLEGALMNFKAKHWKNCVTDDDGRTMTPEQVKREFIKLLGEGKRVIPYGKPCEGFSYQTGCPGHPIPEVQG